MEKNWLYGSVTFHSIPFEIKEKKNLLGSFTFFLLCSRKRAAVRSGNDVLRFYLPESIRIRESFCQLNELLNIFLISFLAVIKLQAYIRNFYQL